jgi:hypothetical protein
MSDVDIAPAQDSHLADMVETNCGSGVLDGSVWVAVCPEGSAVPCSIGQGSSPSLINEFLVLNRQGHWLVWYQQ